MGTVEANVARVRARIGEACRRAGRSPEAVGLVVVTKYAAPTVVPLLMKAGVTVIGESTVQGALTKAGPGVELQMIGHLQTNKVKKAVEIFRAIHSLDREALAEELEKRLAATSRTIDAYIQVNVSGEDTKHGTAPDGAARLVEFVRAQCPSIRLRGLMTMAPHAEEPEASRPIFRRLAEIAKATGLDGLSMGMSQDFEVAIEEGATVVRVGAAIVREAVECRS